MSDLTCTNCGEYVGSPIADRIEELDGIIRQDRERIEELVSMVNSKDDRIEELEAKLAKAVGALGEAIYLLDPDEEDIAKETGLYRIVTTYAELKGETDD